MKTNNGDDRLTAIANQWWRDNPVRCECGKCDHEGEHFAYVCKCGHCGGWDSVAIADTVVDHYKTTPHQILDLAKMALGGAGYHELAEVVHIWQQITGGSTAIWNLPEDVGKPSQRRLRVMVIDDPRLKEERE